METNDSINNSDPSHAVVLQILAGSGYIRSLHKRYSSLKKQLEAEKAEKAAEAAKAEKAAKRTKGTKGTKGAKGAKATKDVEDEENDGFAQHAIQVKNLNERMVELISITANIHTTFRTIPLESKRLKKAKAFFYKGKFPEMDQALDLDAISADQQVAKTDAQRQSLSYELVIKALYHYSFIEKGEWRESVRHLLSLALSISENMYTAYEWGCYLVKTKDTDKDQALQSFDTALALAKKTGGEEGLLYQIKCLRGKGAVEASKKDFAKAADYAAKALSLSDKLVEQNPSEYQPLKIEILTILGDYHMRNNKPAVALIVFEEAVKIRRPLVLLDDYDADTNLAILLDKQAGAHIALGEHEAAFALYNESLQIKDTGVDSGGEGTQTLKAFTLYAMIDAYVAVKDYDSALRCGHEAAKLFMGTDLAESTGRVPYSVLVVEKLANIYELIDDIDEAIIQRMFVLMYLSMITPHLLTDETHLEHFTETTYSLAKLYCKNKEYEEYLKKIGDILGLFKRLDQLFPEGKKYLLRAASVYRDIGLYHSNVTHKSEPACFAAFKALEIVEDMKHNDEAKQIWQDTQDILKKNVEP